MITRKIKVLKKIRWKYLAWSFFIGEYDKNINRCVLKRVDIKVTKWNGLVSGNLLVIRVITR